MTGQTISDGVVHRLPDDLRKTLVDDGAVLTLWEAITPLARNEWICWIEDAKQLETRQRRIRLMHEQLRAGKRRPCCWPGCPHREKTGGKPKRT